MVLHDITEQKKNAESLLYSDRRYKDITESLPQLLWTCRADGLCDYLSPQWIKYTGIPEEKQLGYGWLEQMHPDDREQTISVWQNSVGKETFFDIEFRIRRADGIYRWFKTRAIPIFESNGKIGKWFGTNTDIDDQKKAEEELKKHHYKSEEMVKERTKELEILNQNLNKEIEERKRLEKDLISSGNKLEFLLNSNPAVFYTLKTEGDFGATFISRNVIEQFGFQPEEFLENSNFWLEHIHPEDREQFIGDLALLLEKGKYAHEYRFLKNDGKYIWVHDELKIVKNPINASSEILGYLIDITDQKNIESELQKKEALLQEVGKMAKVGGWEINLETQELFWTEEVYFIHEVSTDYKPLLDEAINFYAPESVPVISKAVQRALENGEPFDLELQIITAKGKKLWVHSKGQVYKVDGKAKKVFGTFQDITERKQNEEELKKYREHLEECVKDRTSELELEVSERTKAKGSLLQIAKELKIRNQIAEIFLTSNDDEMYIEILKIVLETMQSKYGVFGYLDEGGNLVVPTMTRMVWDKCQVPEKNFVFLHEDWGESSWPRAIRNKQIICINQSSAIIPNGHIPIERHISLPIINQGEVIGLLQVANKEADYNEDDIYFLEMIGKSIAPVLDAKLKRERQEADRRRAEESLHESDEKFRHSFEYSPFGKSLTGVDGSMMVNKSFCEMLGYSEEELLRKNWEEITYPEDIQESAEILNSFLEGRKESARYEKRYLHKNGNVVWTEIITTLLRNNAGEPKYFMTNINNITERKKAQEILENTLKNLKRSNEELEQFAYVASHDLQEPLRMVSSYTQLLERRYKDKLDDDAKEFINYAVDGANRMQGLINDLLEYSRITTRGKDFVKVDLSDVLGISIASLKFKIQETNTLITNDELPFVQGDETQLARLFQNLIDNAIKFRGDRDSRIHFGYKDEGNKVIISIQDNGIGINESYKERVFVIFQRLHGKTEYPGTGIGLAICKRIVERHNGRIWFESIEGSGTTFYFTLNK
jgi:PAS domain S-box-containing protein